VVGVGLFLFAGAALIVPACGGGGTIGDNGVKTISAQAVGAPAAVAVHAVAPACEGGGGAGENVVSA
jgi:hypothetical protein